MLQDFYEIDYFLSNNLAVCRKKNSIGRIFFICIEWSMHGIPWLFISTTLCLFNRIFFYKNSQYYNFPYVLLLGILVDLIIVGLIKIIFRRRRPKYNEECDQFCEAPIADKYSFPSGHTSRASMLAVLYFIVFRPTNLGSSMFVMMFPIFLGMSRVMMGRHFVSDIVGGFVLGIIEANVVVNLGDWWVTLLKEVTQRIGVNIF
uniref:AT30094p (inferred by orthology to a D. melanogaster protein) n=1 Tax=Strongyloides venezuelensis TaxID=75913 RepID=A0A0K0FFC7_STRVS